MDRGSLVLGRNRPEGRVELGRRCVLTEHFFKVRGMIVLAACVFCCYAGVALSAGAYGNTEIDSLIVNLRASIDQCKTNLAVVDLDSIRGKADPSRIAADGPPPNAVASNDTFPTKAERSVIAKWMTIRTACRDRFDLLLVVPPTANIAQASSLKQVFALTRASEANVGALIHALYEQRVTYGEFAQKRFEITQAATILNSEIDQALHGQGQTDLPGTERHLASTIAAWEAYIKLVNAREPRTVHINSGSGV
jgi:hypothetical protein